MCVLDRCQEMLILVAIFENGQYSKKMVKITILAITKWPYLILTKLWPFQFVFKFVQLNRNAFLKKKTSDWSKIDQI